MKAKSAPVAVFLVLLLSFLFVAAYKLSTVDFASNEEPKLNLQAYRLDRVECDFEIPQQDWVDCAELLVPEGFKLPVTIIRAGDRHSTEFGEVLPARSVLYFSGGPGAGVSVDENTIFDWLGWYDQADLKRDLVLFDRRATGFSSPQIRCPSYDKFSRDILTQNVTTSDELRLGREVIAQCFKRMGRLGFESADFSTRSSSRDAYELMRALGYKSWNVFGVSYGTRLAIVHASDYPAEVHSLVLDSIYPPGKGLLREWPALLNDALDRYFTYCDGDNQCSDSFKGRSAAEIFWQAMSRLQNSPVSLTVPNWAGGQAIEVLLNDHRLLAVTFSSLYDANTIQKVVPALLAIIQSSDAGLDAVESLVTPFVNYAMDDSFNPWVYLSIECAENAAIEQREYERQIDKYPQLKPYLQGVYRWDTCRQLKAGGTLGGVESLTSKHPMQWQLLLSGGLDPVTPPSWALEYDQHEWQQLWFLPSDGHAVVANNTCVHAQLEAFFQSPKVWRQPEVSCRPKWHP